MRKSFLLGVISIWIFSAQAQNADDEFIRVYGQLLSQEDSASIFASVMYEKLPYYDDMGIIRSGENGSFEFLLLNGTSYAFKVKSTQYESDDFTVLVNDEDGDGSFSFEMYVKPRQATELITLENLIFARGSDVITESSYQELDELRSWLKEHPKAIIQLEGHTDFAGNPDANMRLSNARVLSVKEYLTKKGIKKDRVLTKAFGGTQPITTERSDAAKSKNRRVEVRILNQ